MLSILIATGILPGTTKLETVTYIRATRNSIFSQTGMSGHVSRDLHLMLYSSNTQNGNAAVRICCIYMNIEAHTLIRRKYRSLLYFGNSNRNKI